MINKRFDGPRGIHQDTPFYGFYVRVTGDSREQLKLAQEKATKDMRGIVSNAVLLDELMRVYLQKDAS
ncbi:hypothetical protein [Bosea sp. CS1GBMeth4]|uniref:hypothetical protein n=1 Tax=Bosea sp. CS1GBMeth4 TaxID=1892849 RepID=UPI0016460266|nr:hypothetical protein [Bosea sp. CS1GBMeth4]